MEYVISPNSRLITSRPCVLCASPFSRHPVGSRSHILVPYRPPPFPAPFLLLGTRPPHAFLVERTLLLSSPYPPSAARAGSAPWPTLSPQHEPSVYPIHAVSTFGALRPTSVHHYKIPMDLALLLHPHPLESEAELRDPVIIVELGSSVRGDCVIWEEEGIWFSRKFKSTVG